MKQALVIQHLAFENLGSLEPVLKQHYQIKTWLAGVNDIAEIIEANPDLLIVLGGPLGVYDAKDFPFLTAEIKLLQQRLAKDLPTLGICLGSQLMASALGANVFPGHTKEIGWSPLTLTTAGLQSPLALLNNIPTFHWHGDTFDLPANATLLASSALYPHQAFSWGKHGLALQFHPEVTSKGLEPWWISGVAEINTLPTLSIKKLREETKQFSDPHQKQAEKFWQQWLESLP